VATAGLLSGGIAAGALIAAKLYAFPLVIWLIATKRFREAAIARRRVPAAGQRGGDRLPRARSIPPPLSATTNAAEREPSALSMGTYALSLGGSHALATVVTAGFGLLVMLLIVLASRGSDEGWFTACVTVAPVASPILSGHYLVLLFVPLAISRPRTLWPWMLTVLLWIPYALGLQINRAAVDARPTESIELSSGVALPLSVH
jgi:hypothetical protein